MSNKSVIIIGAGLAGLSAGIYARLNGFNTRIFEHARHPGGVAATWKRKGYTIDGGIHFYMGYCPGGPTHNLYRELGVYQADQYLEMDNYGRYLDLERDHVVDVTQDLSRLEQDLIRISKADAETIQWVIKGAQAFSVADLSTTMSKPPELTNLWDMMKMFFSMRRTLKYYTGRYVQPVKQVMASIRDPWLREFFCHLFLPNVPLSFLMMLLGLLAGGKLARRIDGSAGFTGAMEKRYLDLGGMVSYRSTVDEILVKADKAVGVRLVGGEIHHADYVISAGDGHYALYHLLKGQYLDEKRRKLYENWPLFDPVVMINFGVNRQFHNTPAMVTFRSQSEITAGFIKDPWLNIRLFNYGTGYSPPGRMLIQLMLDSAWQPWKDLRNDLAAYKKEKETLALQVINALEALWPGLSGQVEMTDVATPFTWWRYTLNRRGAYEGFALTAKSFSTSVKRTLPGLHNVVMAGQWTVPGGGVVSSMLTGRHAVMLLCRRERRPFFSAFAKS